MNLHRALTHIPLAKGNLLRRFAKFSVVGLLGTVVNVVMLFVNQEFLFRHITSLSRRLNFSLAGAIFVATVHNFLWNRAWTWRDRKHEARHGFFVQLGQYFLACWLAITLQFVLTRIAALWVHYLAANVLAIALAAAVTYVVNDLWTFAVIRSRDRKAGETRTV